MKETRDAEAKERHEEFRPYILPTQELPELTAKAIFLGFTLSIIMAAANAYLGLKVGMTVTASIPAAVVSMAVLRFFRKHNILENNLVQTAASAGESLAAGIIFTLPALILLQYWSGFPYLPTFAIGILGGLLGVLFTIPLRRALIIEGNLTFPEGIATGEVLKAGSEGGAGVRSIAVAGLAGALLKLSQTGLKLFSSSVDGAFLAGRSLFGYGMDLSPALLGVGYIVGLNIAILVFAGGLIAWLFGIPIYTALYGGPPGESGYGAALTIWSTKIRYMGVGAMVVGGIWALLSLIEPIRAGIRSSVAAVRARREGQSAGIPRTERDIPINLVIIGALLLAVPVFITLAVIIGRTELLISDGLYWSTILFGTIFALIAGFVFSSVAGYMAGLVGSSNNPISGVTIATILTASLILLLMLGSQIDFAGAAGQAMAAAATTIIIGAVVASAAAIAGDNMQDLKTGRIVGATPYKQQIMQMIGVVAGALALAPVLQLLFNAYGLGGVFPRPGMDESEMLAAPQATLMNSVAQGVFAGDLEWGMISIGALIAMGIITLDQILKARNSEFRTPVLAVAVGIYLPLELSVPIFIGGLVAHFAGHRLARRARRGAAFDEVSMDAGRRGLLFASGLITGEALIGIFLAIPFAAAQNTDVLRIVPSGFEPIANFLGVLAIAGLVYWLYRTASRS
ncbi:MAG: OPT family oligopeptide transporter [Acidobacteriota bacterium]